MSKIKVLHIITRLDPGGSSTNTIETVARLDGERFEVFLISGHTQDPDGSIQRSLLKKNIAYLFFPDLQREINPWKDLEAFFELYRFIKKQRFDIVHTHSSKAGILGRWAAKLAGTKKIIHTPHGHVFYGYFGAVKTKIFVWVERLTAMITDKIITLTNRGKQEHIDFKIAPPEKFTAIYSGIDIPSRSFFKSEAEKKAFKDNIRLAENGFIFGTVARFEPIKGISFIIDALGLLVKQYANSHLLLVGDGPQRQKLQDKIESLGLRDHVTFAGFQKDVDPYLECMDVFVLASLNEGMGRVILEAMAYAKPVIATTVGGIPELIDDGTNGFLVPAQNADAMSAAMKRFLDNKALAQEMGRSAKIKVGAQFTLDKMVREIERLYV